MRGSHGALEAAPPPLELESAEARDAFLARVRALPPATVMHIPVCMRARQAVVPAGLVEGMANEPERAICSKPGASCCWASRRGVAT